MAGVRACGKRAEHGLQSAKSVRPDLRSVAVEKPGSAGGFFAPCMISSHSTRKGGLGGKARAPCILNRPIAPGNGYIRRGSCHSDLEKHTFRANIARKRAYFAHSAKKGCIWRDSCQLDTKAVAVWRRDARLYLSGAVAPAPQLVHLHHIVRGPIRGIPFVKTKKQDYLQKCSD